MKFMKWKTFFITSAVCLLTILPGLLWWGQLPGTMAIHFDINNHPDNFASKSFVVFGLPCLMVLLQFLCCFINDINSKKHGERKKFELVTKWIIPIMAVILQLATLGYGLGWELDIRRIAMCIVGVVMIAVGNYLPKFDYVRNYNVSTDKARKINRFLGFETVLMGVLALISLFLEPIFSVVWLILLIPYAAIGIVYGIVIFNKNAFEISEKLFADINEFIDDNYVDLQSTYYPEQRRSLFNMSLPFEPMTEDKAAPEAEDEKMPAPKCSGKMPDTCFSINTAANEKTDEYTLEDIIGQIDESFSEMLLRKIDERGMKDSECYKKANIDRRLFSKIRSDSNYKPSKPTVIAFAIALELSMTETKDMLMKAGFALSHSNKFDLIIEYFISKGNYDIFEINQALFAFDQNLLGA